MKLDFNMDITESSYSIGHTPPPEFLPLISEGMGYFQARQHYYTKREGASNYLLIFTLKGTGLLHYRDTQFTLEKGDIFLIHCLEPHLYQTAHTAWDFRWIHLNGTGIKEYQSLLDQGGFHPIHFEELHPISELFNQLETLMPSLQLKSELQINQLLTELLTRMVLEKLELHQDTLLPTKKQEMSNILDYLHLHFHEKLTLEQLAHQAHMSKYHFIRVFKQYTGYTPYEYLTKYRIDTSKSLLKNTDLTITEISYQVGYSTSTNYIRDFKKYTQTTPGHYRHYPLI